MWDSRAVPFASLEAFFDHPHNELWAQDVFTELLLLQQLKCPQGWAWISAVPAVSHLDWLTTT